MSRPKIYEKDRSQLHIRVAPEIGNRIKIIAFQKGLTIQDFLVEKVEQWYKEELEEGEL
jgi:predicted DNA binding CopG/RHH family protein